MSVQTWSPVISKPQHERFLEYEDMSYEALSITLNSTSELNNCSRDNISTFRDCDNGTEKSHRSIPLEYSWLLMDKAKPRWIHLGFYFDGFYSYFIFMVLIVISISHENLLLTKVINNIQEDVAVSIIKSDMVKKNKKNKQTPVVKWSDIFQKRQAKSEQKCWCCSISLHWKTPLACVPGMV